MAEGDETDKSERAAALARKLTGGRSASGALGKQPTGAPPDSAPDAAVQSKRDAMLAARRASLAPTGNEPAPKSERAPTKSQSKQRTRPVFLALGVLVLLALLAVGGFYGKQMLYERSTEGRVVAQLLAWEFTPSSDNASREAAWAELDRMGGTAAMVAVDKLGDPELPSRGSSHSSRSMQLIAHHYLMHVASNLKVPPPPIATDIAKSVLEGANVPGERWNASRDAWRAWVSELQAKGALGK